MKKDNVVNLRIDEKTHKQLEMVADVFYKGNKSDAIRGAISDAYYSLVMIEMEIDDYGIKEG